MSEIHSLIQGFESHIYPWPWQNLKFVVTLNNSVQVSTRSPWLLVITLREFAMTLNNSAKLSLWYWRNLWYPWTSRTIVKEIINFRFVKMTLRENSDVPHLPIFLILLIFWKRFFFRLRFGIIHMLTWISWFSLYNGHRISISLKQLHCSLHIRKVTKMKNYYTRNV